MAFGTRKANSPTNVDHKLVKSSGGLALMGIKTTQLREKTESIDSNMDFHLMHWKTFSDLGGPQKQHCVRKRP